MKNAQTDTVTTIRRPMFLMFAIVAAVMVLASPASAQFASGNIAGVVRDTTGAVLPGVTVEAASPALIERVRAVVTNSDGQYKILDLRPGTYVVTFSLTGFASLKREGIELTTGFTATVNAELRVGALEETITVSGSTPVVDVQNVKTQAVISHDVLSALPTGKTIGGYTALTVGMSQAAVGAGQDVGGNQGEVASSMIIHGNRGGDQRMMVEGMTYQQAWGTLGGIYRNYMVSQGLVQEYRPLHRRTHGRKRERRRADVGGPKGWWQPVLVQLRHERHGQRPAEQQFERRAQSSWAAVRIIHAPGL